MSAEQFILLVGVLAFAGAALVIVTVALAEREDRTPRDDRDRIHREWLEREREIRRRKRAEGRDCKDKHSAGRLK